MPVALSSELGGAGEAACSAWRGGVSYGSL